MLFRSGGLCVISSALDDDGAIRHLNDRHQLVFGARGETKAGVVELVASALDGAGFEARASDNIEHEMWEKWVMLATLAGATCLMRGSIGDILESPGGEALILGLLDECSATAQQQGHAPSPSALERIRSMLATPRSPLTASMLRDIERGAPIEADHVLGDLLRRADEQKAGRAGNTSILRTAYTHLKVYEARRARGLPTG